MILLSGAFPLTGRAEPPSLLPSPTPSLLPSNSPQLTPSRPLPSLVPTPAPTSSFFGDHKLHPHHETTDGLGVGFAVSVGTTFPLWQGINAELTLFKHLSFLVGYGYLPGIYSNLIADSIAQYGGNHAYGVLFQDIFLSDTMPHFEINLRFTGEYGFFMGFSGYFIAAKGQLNVIDTIQNATGLDLSVIRNYLNTIAQEPWILSQSNFGLIAIHLGYNLKLLNHFGLQLDVGFAKVISSSMNVSTNYAIVNNDPTVQQLYSLINTSVQSIMAKYGYLPMGTVSVRYSF